MRNNGTPQNQANNRHSPRAGKGGIVPPVEHRFKPGQSGNPGGRPKGATLLGVIRDLLDERNGDGRRKAGKAFVSALSRGSFNHAKELIEREEGKIPEDGTVRIEIVYVDPRSDDSAQDEASARRAAACN